MKKPYIVAFLLLLALINVNAQEQDPRWALTQPIEVEIETYINDNIDSFQLSNEDQQSINEDQQHENLSQTELENILLSTKKDRLRNLYFQYNPTNKNLYLSTENNSKQSQQNCNNGNLESGFNNYNFFWRTNWNHPGGTNVNLGQNMLGFNPLIPSGNLNNNSNASLVTPGLDPTIQSAGGILQRVFNGNRAIRLNPRNDNQENATILTRQFNIDEPILSINFAVAFNNPNHSTNDNPFVRFEVFDLTTNTVVDSRVITSDNSGACLINTLNDPPNSPANTQWRYTPWSCLNLDVSQSIGNNVQFRAIISDCSATVHDAILYLDDICNSGNVCNNSLFGDLFLDPVNINCPTDSFQVCGTFSNPSCVVGNPSITLDIVDATGLTIPVSSTPIIDLINGTFCFTVNPSDFGVNPSGNYEFLATATFGSGSQAITIQDNDANVGADVSFINCPPPCPTAGDDVTITLCNNDNTDYDLNTFLVNADSGGLWSYNNGIYNALVDFNITNITYTIPATQGCLRSTATITIIIDNCTNPCNIEDLNIGVSGSHLQWLPIAASYELEFYSDGECTTEEGTFLTATYSTTDTIFDIPQVTGIIGTKGFRYRIRTNCSDWSEWCCLAPLTGGNYALTGDCIASNPCDNYEDFILITDAILTGTTVEYLSYVDIEATNTIQANAISNYRASNSVKLKPGFHAVDNSNFRAYINDCISSTENKNTNKNKFSKTTETKSKLDTKDLKVFPNPAQNELNMTISKNKLVKCKLYNIQGQLIKSIENINNYKQTINVQDLSRGFYILRVTLDDGSITNKNIILK